MQKTFQLQLFLAVLILGFLTGPRVIVALQRFDPSSNHSAVSQAASSSLAQQSVKIVTNPENPYDKVSLQAKSAYVWDVTTHRKLYDLHGGERLPLASVTKIMTALVATESVPPQTKITITPADLFMEGDTGLNVGETWTLQNLLKFTLVASSNDGASAIAAAVGASLATGTSTSWDTDKKFFIEQMNEKAQALGLTQTSFQNESGLDINVGDKVSGAYGSARDMAMLFEYVFRKHPEIFTATSYPELDIRSENNILHHVSNTNQDVEHITGIIGSKTGYTDLAGGNLVVVVDVGINHPVVIAVLGSTEADRFSDVSKLVAATTQFVTQQTP